MSYNIRSLRDDKRAVVRVIRDVDPDVVCIQEAPRFAFWRRKCAWLARSTGLVIAAGGRVAAANILLVRDSVTVEANHSVLFTKDPKRHQRGCAMALLRHSGRPFIAAGTHLDGWPEPRLRHVRELYSALDLFAPDHAPFVLAGDFNDDPGSRVWSELSRRATDAYGVAGVGDGLTLNVTEPTRRIDAVFAGPGVAVQSARSIDSPDVRSASDHRPVVAELELG